MNKVDDKFVMLVLQSLDAFGIQQTKNIYKLSSTTIYRWQKTYTAPLNSSLDVLNKSQNADYDLNGCNCHLQIDYVKINRSGYSGYLLIALDQVSKDCILALSHEIFELSFALFLEYTLQVFDPLNLVKLQFNIVRKNIFKYFQNENSILRNRLAGHDYSFSFSEKAQQITQNYLHEIIKVRQDLYPEVDFIHLCILNYSRSLSLSFKKKHSCFPLIPIALEDFLFKELSGTLKSAIELNTRIRIEEIILLIKKSIYRGQYSISLNTIECWLNILDINFNNLKEFYVELLILKASVLSICGTYNSASNVFVEAEKIITQENLFNKLPGLHYYKAHFHLIYNENQQAVESLKISYLNAKKFHLIAIKQETNRLLIVNKYIFNDPLFAAEKLINTLPVLGKDSKIINKEHFNYLLNITLCYTLAGKIDQAKCFLQKIEALPFINATGYYPLLLIRKLDLWRKGYDGVGIKNVINDLKVSYQQTEDITLKIEILDNLYNYSMSCSDYAGAAEYINQKIRLAEGFGMTSQVVAGKINLAIILLYQKRYTLAKKILENAFIQAQKIELYYAVIAICQNLFLLAVNYKYKINLHKIANAGLSAAQYINDPETLNYFRLVKGYAEFKSNRFAKAINQTIVVLASDCSNNLKIQTKLLQGKIYYSMRKFADAFVCFFDGICLFESQNDIKTLNELAHWAVNLCFLKKQKKWFARLLARVETLPAGSIDQGILEKIKRGI